MKAWIIGGGILAVCACFLVGVRLGTPKAISPLAEKKVFGKSPPSAKDRQGPARAESGRPTLQPADPIDAALISAETNSDRTSDALAHAADLVLLNDIPGVLDRLTQRPAPAAAELSRLLVRRWAEANPAQAASWAIKFAAPEQARSQLHEAGAAWAGQDLDAAIAFARGLPNSANQQAITMAVAYEAASIRPLAALELASSLPQTPERDNLLVHAVSQWTLQDPVAAAQWASKVEDSELRQHLISAVAIASAEKNGPAAATLTSQAMEPGDEQNRTAVSIVQRWAQRSPQDAALWVKEFPESPLRDAAVENLLAAWVPQDPEAASAWLRQLPDAALYEDKINSFSQKYGNSTNRSGPAASSGGS